MANSEDEQVQPASSGESAQPQPLAGDGSAQPQPQASDEAAPSGKPDRIWMKTESIRSSGESREDFIQRLRKPDEETRSR